MMDRIVNPRLLDTKSAKRYVASAKKLFIGTTTMRKNNFFAIQREILHVHVYKFQ